MNKSDFVKCVSDVLRTNGIKKPVSIPKRVFHISDDDGNSKDFSVKTTEKSVIFTKNDVNAIIDACIYVAQESLKRGEPITFHGFGTLGLNYRKPRKTKCVGTDDDVVIDGRYVPKFSFGNDLRLCAKMYELSLKDRFSEPLPEDDLLDEGGE